MSNNNEWPCDIYRIQGPPGCGKTHYLTHKIIPRAVHLFREEGVHVCSLTNAAAAEIGSRANLPPQNVTTLHALAYRARGKPPLAQDAKNVVSWNNSVRAEWRVTGQSKRSSDDLDFSADRKEDGDSLLNEAGVLRARMIPTREWTGPVLVFYQAWRAWKREHQYLDFTDLIESPVEFNTPPPGHIQALITDESQDLTYLDIALIRHWASGFKMVVMAGDANQALYNFVGAHPHAFMPPEIPDEEIKTLTQSYRVPRAVLEYANSWIEQDTEHRIFPYKPRKNLDGTEAQGAVKHLPGMTLARPAPLVREVKRRVKEGSTVMILATCKYQLTQVIACLKLNGVPFHNPYRLKEGAWNPLRGGAGRMADFLRVFRSELSGGENGWGYPEIMRWGEPLIKKGTFRHGAWAEVKFHAKKGSGITQDELNGLFVEEAYDSMLDAAQEEDPASLIEWYASRLGKAGGLMLKTATAICEHGDIAALEATPSVIVGTGHSVKGGSSDVIYISPDLGAAAMKEYDNLTEPDGRNSIIRTYYVMLTRAFKAVGLLGASSRNCVKWI